NMPSINGIDLSLAIQKEHPKVKVIAISNIDELSIVQRMLDSGASGYLLKNVSASELIGGIKDVMQGEQALSSEIATALNATTDTVPKTTQREATVLQLMADGLTTPQIAEKMFISPLTVESHRRNLLQKFQVSNAVSLVHKA